MIVDLHTTRDEDVWLRCLAAAAVWCASWGEDCETQDVLDQADEFYRDLAERSDVQHPRVR